MHFIYLNASQFKIPLPNFHSSERFVNNDAVYSHLEHRDVKVIILLEVFSANPNTDLQAFGFTMLKHLLRQMVS